MAGEYYAGLGFLIVEVSRHTTLARITDPLPPARFELAIRASERPQTRALDRIAVIRRQKNNFICYVVNRLPVHDQCEVKMEPVNTNCDSHYLARSEYSKMKMGVYMLSHTG